MQWNCCSLRSAAFTVKLYRIRIVAQRANRSIMVFYIVILQYRMIFTYQMAVVKCRREYLHKYIYQCPVTILGITVYL